MADTQTPQVVDFIEVRQDVGKFEPVYKRVRLALWSDGTVTWLEKSQDEGW